MVFTAVFTVEMVLKLIAFKPRVSHPADVLTYVTVHSLKTKTQILDFNIHFVNQMEI